MTSTTTWTARLPVVLSIAALAAALLGSTSVGQAFSGVSFAKRAAFAKNAGAVNGIKASRTPMPGKLVPLGQDGKFPASVGLAGPQGPKGDTGAQGPAGTNGVSGWGYYVVPQDLNSKDIKTWSATCPAGQKPLGGGVARGQEGRLQQQILDTAPLVDPDATGWVVTVYNLEPVTVTDYAWVTCASVS
jgi:hypothetical protein